jgi:hypothetical protein
MTGRIKSRAIVIQKKTGRPVQFEITEQTRDTVARWIDTAGLRHGGGVGQKCPKRLRLPAGKSTYEHMGRIVPFSDLCAAQKALIPRHAPNKNDGACRASSEREKRHAAVSAPIRAVKSARSLHPSFSGLAAPQRAPE